MFYDCDIEEKSLLLLFISKLCRRETIVWKKPFLEWHPANCHDSQQSFDHCLYVCWHLRHRLCASRSRTRLCATDKVCDLTHFVSRTNKCRNFHSIISLRSQFEIHNNNKKKSFMSLPHSERKFVLVLQHKKKTVYK